MNVTRCNQSLQISSVLEFPKEVNRGTLTNFYNSLYQKMPPVKKTGGGDIDSEVSSYIENDGESSNSTEKLAWVCYLSISNRSDLVGPTKLWFVIAIEMADFWLFLIITIFLSLLFFEITDLWYHEKNYFWRFLIYWPQTEITKSVVKDSNKERQLFF